MCFSATGSFAISGVLTAVGAVSVARNSSKPHRMFAAIPLIFALWSGKLSAFGIAVGSFGAIMAFLLIRHLYRASGCWIVHDGDLRIERLSLEGTIEVITVGGDDVVYIDVESGGRRASHYAIAIRLRSGRKIRSPVLVGKDQTRAVQAEITRRLRLDRSGAG